MFLSATVSLKDSLTASANAMRASIMSLDAQIVKTGKDAGVLNKGLALPPPRGGYAEAAAAMGGVASAALAAGAVVATALGGIAFAGLKLAIEQKELTDEMLASFTAMAGSAAGGQKVLDLVNDMSNALPDSRAQITEWTNSFMAMGTTDLGELNNQILAIASASALLPKEGAAAYEMFTRKITDAANAHEGLKLSEKQIVSLTKTGVSYAEVAKTMGVSVEVLRDQLKNGTANAQKFGDALQQTLIAKGAGPLANKVGDIATLIIKTKENIGRLFDDVAPRLEPLLKSIQEFSNIFTDALPSGRALKFLITKIFGETADGAASAMDLAQNMFLRMILLALKTYIAMKPAIKAFKEFKIPPALKVTLGIVGELVTGIVKGAVLLAVVITAVNAAFLALPIVIMTVLGEIGSALLGLNEQGFKAAVDLLQGIWNGLKAGGGMVVDAVKSIGHDIAQGLRDALGIHSPSKIMTAIGGHVAGGLAGGIHAGAGGVAKASTRLGATVATAAPKAALGIGASRSMSSSLGMSSNDNMIPQIAKSSAPPPSAAPSGGGKGKGVSVNVEPGAIVINGGGKSAVELTEEAVTLIFERIALAQGA